MSARASRHFFYVHYDGRVQEVTGYECAGTERYWWCPEVGVSAAEGYSLFRDRVDAYDKAFAAARNALEVAKANLARIEAEAVDLETPHPASAAGEDEAEAHDGESRMRMAEITLRTRVKLLRAELVADHWRKVALEWADSQMPGRMLAHPLGMVLTALQGDTSDPTQLGVVPESPEGRQLSSLAKNEP